MLHALYRRLPPPLQSVAATARGLSLRAWRYGGDSERLVEEALARDSWSPAQWSAFREERLARLLFRAASRVPFYRDLWAARRRAGDRRAVERLENWPLLEKRVLRARPAALLADDRSTRWMFGDHTSGTTGAPVHVWLSRGTVRAWYALFEARVRRWNGVSRHDRWAILGGQLVVPASRRRPPYGVWNAALNQLYLSSYHLAADTVGDYLEAFRRHRVRYVLGYPSSLDSLARFAAERGVSGPPLEVAIGNAEPFYEHQRAAVARLFQCPARDTYGMAEIACGASECSAGRLHLWPDAGETEILADDDERPVNAGGSGRLVATGLLNEDMPLIRYVTGDRAALGIDPCACGRTLPTLRSLEGRSDDVVVTPDGRRIGRFDPVFKRDVPVLEAQIVQDSLARIRVRVVPGPGFDAAAETALVDRVRQRVGDGPEVSVEIVDRIARTPAGKFQAVISHVSRGADPGTAPPPASPGGRE